MPKPKKGGLNRYQAIILRLFENHYTEGLTEFEFSREEIVAYALSDEQALLAKVRYN